MELDLGSLGLFYAWAEDVDTSGVHATRRLTASGTWRRVPEGEDEPIESEAVLFITLEEYPPLDVTDPEVLIDMAWEDFWVLETGE